MTNQTFLFEEFDFVDFIPFFVDHGVCARLGFDQQDVHELIDVVAGHPIHLTTALGVETNLYLRQTVLV